jgi:hypothetical protein
MSSIRGLRQHWCAHCGYSLRGLRSDRCPECGESFGPDQIVIFGWPETLLVGRSKNGCLMGLGVYFAIGFLVAAAVRDWSDAGIYGVLLLIMFSYYPVQAVSRVVSRRERLRPWNQLRLTPEGYGGRSGFGPVKLWEWTPDMEVDIVPLKGRVYKMTLVRVSSGGVVQWSTKKAVVFRATASRVAQIRSYVDARRAAAREALAWQSKVPM